MRLLQSYIVFVEIANKNIHKNTLLQSFMLIKDKENTINILIFYRKNA
ncbi:hypothetical protein HMPREF0971_02932 [Segatella oris F0302]|uniref:Uncharacterized protein n=1 Tax=Segatella oris F0302 TaxID=649760 RepID=D1QVF4_9BACT|nr:hypothetical protein HMPREF0971_02932 [Segatella oris F0302]